MKIIKCRCGADIPLDDWNFQKVIDFSESWSCLGRKAKTVGVWKSGGKGTRVFIPITCLIMQTEGGKVIDHIDRNPHNNLESNLRPATNSQNMCNKGRQRNNTSGFKNVSFNKGVCKYQVYVQDGNGKRRFIGVYATAELAAEYADMAMLQFRGEFAVLNFPHRKDEYLCRMEVKQRTGREFLI